MSWVSIILLAIAAYGLMILAIGLHKLSRSRHGNSRGGGSSSASTDTDNPIAGTTYTSATIGSIDDGSRTFIAGGGDFGGGGASGSWDVANDAGTSVASDSGASDSGGGGDGGGGGGSD